MKNILLLLSVFFPLIAYSQSWTFEIEKLERPQSLLPCTHANDIYKLLINKEGNIRDSEIEKYDLNIPYNIVANKQEADSLISYGYKSLFMGMYQAYADHRPFVLSPDIVWLLISQGFAHHVNSNSDKLRHHFVNFEGKQKLVVYSNQADIDNPDSPWEDIFSDMTKEIAKYTGEDLMNTLTADFSTTTSITKVASEITIMESMKSYFEYVAVYIVCGIPEITLEGTIKDWENVLAKAQYLRRYELDWWIDELEPILEEFVKASKGVINKAFWMNMFKKHSLNFYGSPQVFDGWIVKFYPYDNRGKQKRKWIATGFDDLPDEIVKVDLEYIKLYPDGKEEHTPLQLWAGFIGLQQNKQTFALKPEIGWMIRKADIQSTPLAERIKLENNRPYGGGLHIKVDKVPQELIALKKISKIGKLRIDFIDIINIPEEMDGMDIQELTLTGKIDEEGIDRIRKMFRITSVLTINGKKYYNEKRF